MYKRQIFEYTNVNDYNRLLVYYPRKGGTGVPGCDFTYELLVTPTPTPTSSITPTITPTSSITPTPSITPSITPTSSITPTPTPSSSSISLDPDAAAYLADVVATGGTTNPTIEAAVNTLFTDLKSNGLYNDLFFYPVVGGVASSQRLAGNRSAHSSYDFTFNGGITHDYSGFTFNGVNGYVEVPLYRSIYSNQNDVISGFESLTEGSSAIQGFYDQQSNATDNNVLIAKYTNGSSYIRRNGGFKTATNSFDGTGFYISSMTGTTMELMRNGVSPAYLSTTGSDADYQTSGSEWLGRGGGGSGLNGNDKKYSFLFYGKYISPSQQVVLSNIINTFQTSLGRNTY